MLGSKQTETEQGKQFLETATMADMCKVSIYIIILEMATMADMCKVSIYIIFRTFGIYILIWIFYPSI